MADNVSQYETEADTMMIPVKKLFFPPMLILVLFVLFLPGRPAEAQESDARFLLFYSNDMRAELEPCG